MPTGKAPSRVVRPSSEKLALRAGFGQPDGPATQVGLAQRRQVMAEIVAIVVGLEADQVVMNEAADDLLVVGHRGQYIGRRAGNVEEEADRIDAAARPEFARQRHQMIVVNPDDVVLLDDRFELIGEQAVDAHVAALVGARIFLQIDPIVQDRPQHPVGEAVVIFLVIGLGEVDDRVFDPAAPDAARRRRFLIADVAAPAEPDADAFAQRGLDGDRQPAGKLLARVGKGHSIRDDDQARSHASSQLDDRRVAVLIMPAIEYA